MNQVPHNQRTFQGFQDGSFPSTATHVLLGFAIVQQATAVLGSTGTSAEDGVVCDNCDNSSFLDDVSILSQCF